MPSPILRWLTRAFAIVVAALALYPLGRLTMRWVEYMDVVGPLEETPPSGFDGVRWVDGSVGVEASYVFPRSTAALAGLQEGDLLTEIDYMPVASAEDVDRQVERATGTILTYEIQRNGVIRDVSVRIARDPTFLYPLSAMLWQAAGWGFAVVAFLHLLAYLTVTPLAERSPRARRSKFLIGAALVWVGGNLLRLMWMEVWGPPSAENTTTATVFDALTLLALSGWILYPLLLLDQSLRAWRAAVLLGTVRWVFVLPPVVLCVGVVAATLAGNLGPLPPNAFVVPILFYVCVYVAAATGLSLFRPVREDEDPGRPTLRWSRIGSALVTVVAALGAVFVMARIAPSPRTAELSTAWFVTGFQLFSLLPVALVSLSTLRYGQFNVFLIRGVASLLMLGVAFLVVAVGTLLLDLYLPSGPHPLALGILVVAVLALLERLSPALRDGIQRSLRTDRQQARRRLDRLGEEIRQFLDVEQLADASVRAAGEALGVQSAAVFLQSASGTPDERWVKAAYRPEPPSFTQTDLESVWERIRNEGLVWSRNEELNESTLPTHLSNRLERLRVALAVPVTTGQGAPVGLIVLGRKARRFAVYNTEDVDRLRSLAAQLAVAVERLRLLDRERALVRQTAEAELVALRAQINPHFLFNALNTVAALISERPDEAEATVEHLAGLFRDVLNASGQALVPLRDELRLVERYLNVEQARFGDALAVTFDVAPEALDRLVPAFAVQTLVENAVKHGIERKRGGGRVDLTAQIEGESLRVDVVDTGAGLAPSIGGDGATPETTAIYGVGLSNVDRRLAQLYGADARLTVCPDPPGTRATLTLPMSPRPVS